MRWWGVGLLIVSSATIGCLKSDEEAKRSRARPSAQEPDEKSEAEQDDSVAQSEPPASSAEPAAPKVKVTLDETLDDAGKGGKKSSGVPSRPRPGRRIADEGEGPSDAFGDPSELAAIATGSKLSEKDIRKVAEAHLDDIGGCYARESVDGPLHMEVRLTVGPGGEVTDASVDVEGATESMKECVVKAVGDWEFPAPEGGGVVKLRFPFTLQPID